jgi:hypothetical protein
VAVTVTKVVYSTADSVAVLKFLNNGTQGFEAEAGLTINEPGTLAVKATIEAAVVELIKEGERRGVWDYKKPVVTAPVVIPEVIIPEKKEEPKVVEKQPEVVIIPEKKEEPKVEEKKPEVKPSVMILIKDVYVKLSPDGPLRMWFFGKDTEVVISSPVDSSSEWVEVKDKNGRKGYTKRENLKEKN